MAGLFRNFREKPRHIQRSIALVLTLIVFGWVVMIWLSTKDAVPNSDQYGNKSPSPFESLGGIFSGAFDTTSKDAASTTNPESVPLEGMTATSVPQITPEIKTEIDTTAP